VNEARSRLAAHAAAAGYPPNMLGQIADAVLPRYTPGDRLDDRTVDQVADAVRVIAQVGYDHQQLQAVIDGYRERHGDQWRQPFWTRTLAIAAVRYQHPDHYGLSPCETDPERVARFARLPAAAA
jgi:hypothetical protein